MGHILFVNEIDNMSVSHQRQKLFHKTLIPVLHTMHKAEMWMYVLTVDHRPKDSESHGYTHCLKAMDILIVIITVVCTDTSQFFIKCLMLKTFGQ